MVIAARGVRTRAVKNEARKEEKKMKKNIYKAGAVFFGIILVISVAFLIRNVIVEKRAEHLQNLITSFYDLSRLNNSEFKFNLKKINLKTMLCDSIAMYYNDFLEKHIEPTIEIDEKIDDIISDEGAVERIFSNLIGNMLKYADKNIKISLSQDKKYIVSKFENLAPNLKEEDMDKLFDRFYTADKSRSDKNTGLGLAITKVLIEKLGHKIDAKLVNGSLIIEIKWNNLRGVS